MDSRLKDRLKKWNDQIDALAKIEGRHFLLAGNEDSLEASLRLSAPASYKTVNDKDDYAHNHEDWVNFQTGFAASKTEYNEAKRKLDLLIKAYEAEYLTVKIEEEIIQRGKGGQ